MGTLDCLAQGIAVIPMQYKSDRVSSNSADWLQLLICPQNSLPFGPKLCVKYFHQRKLRQTRCLLFNFLMIKLIKTQILPNCQVQNGFFWCNRKFYHQKMEK